MPQSKIDQGDFLCNIEHSQSRALGLATIFGSSMAEAQYQLKNLVSNQVKQAAHTDPLLVNGWGLVHGPWHAVVDQRQ